MWQNILTWFPITQNAFNGFNHRVEPYFHDHEITENSEHNFIKKILWKYHIESCFCVFPSIEIKFWIRTWERKVYYSLFLLALFVLYLATLLWDKVIILENAPLFFRGCRMRFPFAICLFSFVFRYFIANGSIKR